MKSRFFDDVGDKPLQEYPRPQLVRSGYLNLNGLWKYAIRGLSEEFDGNYDGDILVPFSPETLLSRVQRKVTADDLLYYNLEFEIPDGFLKDKTILHFTAVDYACVVKLNGCYVGSHEGGFFPFDFDVTDSIMNGTNVLQVEVYDPSGEGVQARGKQSDNPGTIWYTPQSGIWGTVWLESVPAMYISDLKIVPDIDSDTVKIWAETEAPEVTVEVLDGDDVIASESGPSPLFVILPSYELWSPENPKLYDLRIIAGEDEVLSYFGMRKFGVGPDENGIQRLMLNNKPYFHNGVLDQGYWSDGMLTAPSDEALIYDIEMLKDMGFNMIRKHIKIEPLRWYYHCDRLGMLVWQDMVNGGGEYNLFCVGILPLLNINLNDTKHRKFFAREDESGREEYMCDLDRTLDLLKNQTSVAMWVPFNEGWGQFDSKAVTEHIRSVDPTRTIDSTSGWHDQGGGDFVSKHIYFYPIYVPKDSRCFLLSEFGGYSKPTPGHMYTKKAFGYHMYPTKGLLQRAYKKLFERRIIRNIPRGLSATVYTQVSDVEGEVNGLITYDRRVEKFDRDFLRKINEKVHL
ncbi:MAG: glycoside hydrolase family 2 [Clostridia bacterium]|nr:glycoside hydrolase family 2 [Clostridia bacterium]